MSRRRRLRIGAACLPGRSHLVAGRPCQDACAVRRISRSRIVVAALADGAGSCQYSQHGARAAVEAVIAHMERQPTCLSSEPFALRRELLDAVRNVQAETAARLNVSLREVSCTLAFAAMWPTRHCLRFVCGNLGDGAVIHSVRRQASLVLPPLRGEYANATWFTTSPDAESQLCIRKGTLPRGSSLLLASDGPLDCLVRAQDGVCAPACSVLSSWFVHRHQHQAQRALTDALHCIRQSTKDDCSLAIISDVV